MLVQKIDSVESLTALENHWRELETSTGVPFKTWDWAVTWWSMMREKRASVADSLFVRTIHDDAGELCAIAPMMITRRPSFGPVCIRQLHFFGADPNLTEQRGLIAKPGYEEAAYGALFEHMAQSAHEWDTALLAGIGSNAVREKARSMFPDVNVAREVPFYEIELKRSWDEFKSALPRNIKESLRKCYNSLKRDSLEYQIEVQTGAEHIEPTLEQFFRLHHARSLAPSTVPHPDIFGFESSRKFLRQICQRFAERGTLRLFRLRVGGNVVALRIGFVVGPKLYLYYSGYEPEFGKYSVMTTTVAEAIKYAIGEGFTHVHLSPGNDVSKTRWRPTETLLAELSMASPSPRGRMVHNLFQGIKRAGYSTPWVGVPLRLLRRRPWWTGKPNGGANKQANAAAAAAEQEQADA